MRTGHSDFHFGANSAAPYQGLGCSWIKPPEFRFASRRALVPAHPSGAPSSRRRGEKFRAIKTRPVSRDRTTPFSTESHLVAPEARRNTARRDAQRNSGSRSNKSSNPWQGVTDRIASKVTLVEWQPMRLQESLEFIEERNASMMFFLPLDVAMNLGDLRLTHRERAVSFLPRKPRGIFQCSRNPTGRVRLQLPDGFRNRLVLAQFRQDVNVVGSSVDDQRDSAFITDCTAEVLMNSGTDCGRQPRLTFLGREDDVVEQIAMGGTHSDADFRRPSSGALVVLDTTPGVPLRSTPRFIPPHPPGASWICRGWRRSDGISSRGRAETQPRVPLRANPSSIPSHPPGASWICRGWRKSDGISSRGPRKCSPEFRFAPIQAQFHRTLRVLHGFAADGGGRMASAPGGPQKYSPVPRRANPGSIPPHPPGASWICRGWRRSDGISSRGRAETQPRVPLRANPGSIPPRPSDALWVGCGSRMGSAPKARRNTGRSAAQRNSGNPSPKFSNPCQGVAELRRAKALT
jgi:hypothetical protein